MRPPIAWITRLLFAVVLATMAVYGGVGTGAQSREATVRATLKTYCVTCHNTTLKTGDLVLDMLDPADVSSHADTWERVVRKLEAGMMPPQGRPQPDDTTRSEVLSYLKTSLDEAARRRVNPGRVGLHRLNRTEYGYTVRDLLALDADVSSLLPPDDSSYGFDNIADVLGMPPALVDRYLSAALKISSLAVGASAIDPTTVTFRVRPDMSQDVRIEGLPIGTRGGLLGEYYFPRDGTYEIRPRLWRTATQAVRGLEYAQQLEITIDGARVHAATFGGPLDDEKAYRNMVSAGQEIEARFAVRLRVPAGHHRVGVAFVQESSAPRIELLKPFLRENSDIDNQNGLSVLDGFAIAGPFDPTGAGDTPSRRVIFSCRPSSPTGEARCARSILATLARRAYRAPVTPAQIDRLMAFYTKGRSRGSFEDGIELAVARILASPEFLVRMEADPANVMPGTAYRLDDYAVASRLSFFLWRSIPDEELLTLAGERRLTDDRTLTEQVRRMLADPRAARFTQDFAGQWLFLRNLDAFSADLQIFPDFDGNLREAMRTETEMFVDSVRAEDRSVLDWLTADYTFVNERLARHYGMRGIYGTQFRRVRVTDDARRGLLGQASILTVTSYATRTSPVRRGKWVLSNILGVPPPDPPPNVPGLNEAVNGRLSMRQRMEQHRANPVCASCHNIMDPIGFSMENFDAIGRWRTADGPSPIDPQGTLVDGRAVTGVASLRQALTAVPDGFVGTATERLMTFALGRGVESYDMPRIRQIVRDASAANYRFSSLVVGIVTSPAFRMKLKAGNLELGAR